LKIANSCTPPVFNDPDEAHLVAILSGCLVSKKRTLS